MKKPVQFYFERIGNINDFYTVAKRQLNLPEHFGENLDALRDCIIADVELPVSIQFVNMSTHQLETFASIIQLFEDAAD